MCFVCLEYFCNPPAETQRALDVEKDQQIDDENWFVAESDFLKKAVHKLEQTVDEIFGEKIVVAD